MGSVGGGGDELLPGVPACAGISSPVFVHHAGATPALPCFRGEIMVIELTSLFIGVGLGVLVTFAFFTLLNILMNL